MVLAACLLGLVSGFAGIILHDLLEFVEGLVFGHSEHESSFLTDGVPPYRIGISLLIVGLTSALVWYFLQRKGKLLSIKGQMQEEDSRLALHFWRQLLHSSWQIVAERFWPAAGRSYFFDRLWGGSRIGCGLPSPINECVFYF